eukprot:259495_1
MGLFLLCYSWVSGPLWMLVGFYSFAQHMRGDGVAFRDVVSLSWSCNFDDILELWQFGISVNQEDAHWVACLALISCENRNTFCKMFQLFQQHHPQIWNVIEGTTEIGYTSYDVGNTTPLMYALEKARQGETSEDFLYRFEYVLSNANIN